MNVVEANPFRAALGAPKRWLRLLFVPRSDGQAVTLMAVFGAVFAATIVLIGQKLTAPSWATYKEATARRFAGNELIRNHHAAPWLWRSVGDAHKAYVAPGVKAWEFKYRKGPQTECIYVWNNEQGLQQTTVRKAVEHEAA